MVTVELPPRAGRQRARLVSGLAAGALLAAGAQVSAQQEVGPAADLAAIAEFNRLYVNAINSGDIETLGALTSDGHVMLMPNRAPLVGKDALVQAMTGAFQRFDFDESWAPVETRVDGNLAFQRGTYRVAATPKSGGEANVSTGHFMRIYARQADGRWLMIRDMFNSDGADAEAP